MPTDTLPSVSRRHPLLVALEPVAEALGATIISGTRVQPSDIPLHWEGELVGSLRGDYWLSYDGSRSDTPPPAGIPARQVFQSADYVIPSPRVAALFHATPTTDLEASAYQGFRVPTLNELFIHTQPAHLQKLRGIELDTADRNIERARYLRGHLNKEDGNSAGHN